jgi:hypothetical protein
VRRELLEAHREHRRERESRTAQQLELGIGHGRSLQGGDRTAKGSGGGDTPACRHEPCFMR